MINGLCHSGSWGSLGNLGGWGLAGLILTLIFWVGLIAGLALFVVWVLRQARVRAGTAPNATRLTTEKEVLQAQYARGEITREQYKLRKQEI